MTDMNYNTQIAVIVLTIISTITTIWIFISRSSIERATAVCTTLTAITIVLFIEILYHVTNPRPPEYTIMGGVLTEFFLILLLIMYEWVPTLYRLEKYEGVERYMTFERRVLKVFAFFGTIVAVITFIFGIVTFIRDPEKTAKTLDAYGLLFIIPTLGVGEFLILKYGPIGGMVGSSVACLPILYITYRYLDFLNFLTYLTTAAAFFSDAIIGCRHFLKQRYLQQQLQQHGLPPV